MPELYHPGSAGQQRYNALQYDPYPLDDVAPAAAGTRPKEYDRPVPEVVRGQTYTTDYNKPKGVSLPSFLSPTAPVIVAPPTAPGATVSPFAPPASVPYQAMPYQAMPYQAMPYQAVPPAVPPTSTMVRPPY
jgi:hypothetical protein